MSRLAPAAEVELGVSRQPLSCDLPVRKRENYKPLRCLKEGTSPASFSQPLASLPHVSSEACTATQGGRGSTPANRLEGSGVGGEFTSDDLPDASQLRQRSHTSEQFLQLQGSESVHCYELSLQRELGRLRGSAWRNQPPNVDEGLEQRKPFWNASIRSISSWADSTDEPECQATTQMNDGEAAVFEPKSGGTRLVQNAVCKGDGADISRDVLTEDPKLAAFPKNGNPGCQAVSLGMIQPEDPARDARSYDVEREGADRSEHEGHHDIFDSRELANTLASAEVAATQTSGEGRLSETCGRVPGPPTHNDTWPCGSNTVTDCANDDDTFRQELTVVVDEKADPEAAGTGDVEVGDSDTVSSPTRGWVLDVERSLHVCTDENADGTASGSTQFVSSHLWHSDKDSRMQAAGDRLDTVDSRPQDGFHRDCTQASPTAEMCCNKYLGPAEPLGSSVGISTGPQSTMALHVALMDPYRVRSQSPSLARPEIPARSPSALHSSCSRLQRRAEATGTVRFKITSPRLDKSHRSTSAFLEGARGGRSPGSCGPHVATSNRSITTRASTGVRHHAELRRSRTPAPEATRSVSVCHRGSAPGRREERQTGQLKTAKFPPRSNARACSNLENRAATGTKSGGCTNSLLGRPVSCPPRQARNRTVEQASPLEPSSPFLYGSVAGSSRAPLGIEDITRPRDQSSVYSIVLSREPLVTRPGLAALHERCRSVEMRRYDQRPCSTLKDRGHFSSPSPSGCKSDQRRAHFLLDSCPRYSPRRRSPEFTAGHFSGHPKPTADFRSKSPPRTVSWTDVRKSHQQTPAECGDATGEVVFGGFSRDEAECLHEAVSEAVGSSRLRTTDGTSCLHAVGGTSFRASYDESCLGEDAAARSQFSESSPQSPRTHSAATFRGQNPPQARSGSARAVLPPDARGAGYQPEEKESDPGNQSTSRTRTGSLVSQRKANQTDRTANASDAYCGSSPERADGGTAGSHTGSDEAPRRKSLNVPTSSNHNQKGSRRGSLLRSSGRGKPDDLGKKGSLQASGRNAGTAAPSSSKSVHDEKGRQTETRESSGVGSTPAASTASERRLLVSSLRASVDPLAMAIHAKLVESGIISGPLLPFSDGVAPIAKRGMTGGGSCSSSPAGFDPWQSIAAALAQVSPGCGRSVGSLPSGHPWKMHARHPRLSVSQVFPPGSTRALARGLRSSLPKREDDVLSALWTDADTPERKYFIQTVHFTTRNGIEGVEADELAVGSSGRKHSCQLTFLSRHDGAPSTDRRNDRGGEPATRWGNGDLRSRDYEYNSCSASIKRHSARPVTNDEKPGVKGSVLKASEAKSSLAKCAPPSKETKSRRKAATEAPAAGRIAADKSTACPVRAATGRRAAGAPPNTEAVPETLEEWQELNNATGKMVFSAACPPVIRTELLRRGWVENSDLRSSFFHFRWLPGSHGAGQTVELRKAEQRELGSSSFQSTASSSDVLAKKSVLVPLPDGYSGQRLLPYQLTNQFPDTSMLTTKTGLLKSLTANMPFSLDKTYEAIMPRCYSLNLEDHVSSFKEDYVFTQAEAVLKLALLAWVLTSPSGFSIAATTEHRPPGPTFETASGFLRSSCGSLVGTYSCEVLECAPSLSRLLGVHLESTGTKQSRQENKTDTIETERKSEASCDGTPRARSVCSGGAPGDDTRHVTGSTSDETTAADGGGTEPLLTAPQVKGHATSGGNVHTEAKPSVPRLKLTPAVADSPEGEEAALVSAAVEAVKCLSPYAIKAAIYVVKRARAHLSRTTCCLQCPVYSVAELKLLEAVQFPRFTPPQSVFANTAVEAALGLIFETEPASSTETARGIGDRPTGIEGCPDRESGNAGQMQSEEDDQPASAACISQLVREAGDALQWLRKRGTKQWNVNGWRNLWILKPADSCRGGRAAAVFQRLSEVERIMRTKYGPEMLVQKFVECPLTVCGCRVELRHWVLVTSWNPLTVWLYKKGVVHLAEESKRQGGEKNAGAGQPSAQQSARSTARGAVSVSPKEGDVWPSDFLQGYLPRERGDDAWSRTLYPRLKKCITDICRCVQTEMDNRPNSYELFGFDFLVDAFLEPWLLEVTRCPELVNSSSSPEVQQLVERCLTDSLKVVLDWSPGSSADTGLFELIHRGPAIHSTAAIWARQNLHIEGHGFSGAPKRGPNPALLSARTSNSLAPRSRAAASSRAAK